MFFFCFDSKLKRIRRIFISKIFHFGMRSKKFQVRTCKLKYRHPRSLAIVFTWGLYMSSGFILALASMEIGSVLIDQRNEPVLDGWKIRSEALGHSICIRSDHETTYRMQTQKCFILIYEFILIFLLLFCSIWEETIDHLTFPVLILIYETVFRRKLITKFGVLDRFFIFINENTFSFTSFR